MKIDKTHIQKHNDKLYSAHQKKVKQLANEFPNVNGAINKLVDFQIAIPSWALGTGGTRFGRFSGGGEPRNLEEKIGDVGLLHS
jgi:L-rhamnose isomerase/sugar isomerase